MRLPLFTAVCALSVASIAVPTRVTTQAPSGEVVSPRASQIHRRAIVVDTHDDTTQRLLFDKAFDIGRRHDNGSIDMPADAGGRTRRAVLLHLGAERRDGPARGQARHGADRQPCTRQVRRHPRDLVLATTAADVRRAAADGKIAALMGMEGGHMIDDDLGLLRSYADARRPVSDADALRLNTNWADSSGDTPAHNGLTAFGKDVVRELNRLGHDGGCLPRRRQDVLRRARGDDGARHRLPLVLPGDREPSAQHDGRHAASARA